MRINKRNPTGAKRKPLVAQRLLVGFTRSFCPSLLFLLLSGWIARSPSSLRLLSVAEASEERPLAGKYALPRVPYFDEDEFLLSSVSSLLKELDSFVEDAVSYLVRVSHKAEQDPTFPGRFTYQVDLRKSLAPTLRNSYWNPERHSQPDYNLLRHNGAIYALSQVYDRNEKRKKKNAVLKATTAVAGAVGGASSKYLVSKLAPQPVLPTATPQEDILGAMERAVGYLRDNALLPVPRANEKMLAAWERTDPDDPNSEPDTAKLGGAGLAMVALGKLEGIKQGAVSLERELRRLGAFVESLQNKEDGSFTCKFDWKDGPNDEWVSLYYPGEAALGLVELAVLEIQLEEGGGKVQQQQTMVELELEHQYHHHEHYHHDNGQGATTKQSPRWVRVATNALLYLERLRRDQEMEDIEPDHWALLATAKLLPILDQQRKELGKKKKRSNTRSAGSATGDGDSSSETIGTEHERRQADLEYWLVYNHGVRVATSIVNDHTTEGLLEHGGCFTYDSRTCPTSTRLEGLLAAMTFIQDSEVFFGGRGEEEGYNSNNNSNDATELLKDRIERDVDMGIRFLLQAQQKSDQRNMRGAVPGKFTGKQPVFSAKGGNDEDDEDFDLAEVRIDYVQHSLSAVMAYEAYLLDKIEKRNAGKAFHEKVHEKVRSVADPIIHRVRNHIDKATSTDANVNYGILGAMGLLVLAVVCVAYMPWICCSSRHRRRKRRIKRSD